MLAMVLFTSASGTAGSGAGWGPDATNWGPNAMNLTSQLLQKLVFGAVDGIPQVANDRSCHSPEKQTIAANARFRACGRNSTSSQ